MTNITKGVILLRFNAPIIQSYGHCYNVGERNHQNCKLILHRKNVCVPFTNITIKFLDWLHGNEGLLSRSISCSDLMYIFL